MKNTIKLEAINELKDGSTEKGSAVFSKDGKYRYILEREWDSKKPKVCFLMLNPSKANHEFLDPTNTRCRNFAKSWGYGGMVTLNLFALVSTDPKGLRECKNPIGKLNDETIKKVSAKYSDIVLAWGNHGNVLDREKEVLQILKNRNLKYLKMNKTGTPCHPLYLKSDLKPKKFKI